MTTIEKKVSGEGYAVASIGNLAEFEGKAFIKDVLGTTSVEVSFGTLAAGETLPFCHHHLQNEEVYIVISGNGVFKLGADEVEATSGTIIKVEPPVSRTIRSTGTVPLVYLCLQGKAGSLEQYTMTDGVIETTLDKE